MEEIVKSENKILQLALVLFIFLGMSAFAQITPSADSYTNTADSTTNYGAKTLLDVDGASQITYIQLNLASIPTTASISQATLKLYVNGVTTAGSFNVDYINSAWSESTIDASNAPPLGSAIASNVNVTTADKNQYILVNVTSAVQAWLSGSEANNGLALVANSTFNATFDSKENTTTSHAPELDIAFGGGEGTITGVTTSSGSGLTGGGTSGTLNLSLTTACLSGQVLSWNASAWVCTASSGGGTITGVTAGTALTGGGTSGAVTLNLDTTKVPLLAAANTFTGTQTVNGSLTATNGLFGEGTSGYGVLGFSASNNGVDGESDNGYGVYGLGATGVYGISYSSTSGTGVYAEATTGGWAVDAVNTGSGTGILAGSSSGWAAWFNGNVEVDGNLSKAGGSFKIDHPLDPANKYLYHSFVESPDMMDIYNGNATLDNTSEAVVMLPDWFETLNRDFRYQLTCIGGFAPLYISQKVQHNSFKIGGGRPGMEVSWQVTGIRQDAWANAHRIPVEQEKPGG
jgi:hypothetical protein